MVDIHCHILPGMDDGPDTLEESIQMAQEAIADGITHVVATPHANDTYSFDPELIRRRCEELQERIGQELTLATGCDFHLSFENLQAVQKDATRFTINQKNYLLVEFADYAIPPTLDAALQNLLVAGLKPIITHPERNPLLRANRARVDGWVRLGCTVQVTALSLLGRFGPAAQKAAEAWLDADGIHFIASDAHNLSGRPLKLRQAYEVVAQRRDEAVAKALFHDNPLAAFEGRVLPYQPAPAEETQEKTRRKKFFFF